MAPTELVTTAVHDADATPEPPASLALGDAEALAFSSTGFGETDGSSVGPVASRLTVTVCVALPPPLVALHVNVVPALSLVTVVGPQPNDVEIADSASTTVQLTFTLLVYQPLFSVPATTGVMTGGVASVGSAPARTYVLKTMSDRW